jgi:hypothetical protein
MDPLARPFARRFVECNRKICAVKRHDATFEQGGKVYMKDGLPYMYLVTIDAGEVRHIVLSRTLTPNGGTFRGLIQTLWRRGGEQYMPVNAPIVLHKISGGEHQFDLGKVDPTKPMYNKYREMLAEVTANGFVQQVFVNP